MLTNIRFSTYLTFILSFLVIVQATPHQIEWSRGYLRRGIEAVREFGRVGFREYFSQEQVKRDVVCVSDEFASIFATKSGASSFCSRYTGAQQQTITEYTTPIVYACCPRGSSVKWLTYLPALLQSLLPLT